MFSNSFSICVQYFNARFEFFVFYVFVFVFVFYVHACVYIGRRVGGYERGLFVNFHNVVVLTITMGWVGGGGYEKRWPSNLDISIVFISHRYYYY